MTLCFSPSKLFAFNDSCPATLSAFALPETTADAAV